MLFQVSEQIIFEWSNHKHEALNKLWMVQP